VVLAATAAVLVGGCASGAERPAATATAAPPAPDAAAATARFLDAYLEPDGRIVRRDQGGDTVSEGQAYALLLTALNGDQARFDRVWRWTRDHLQRPDGLLAWHWSDGSVVDWSPATDADLDAARALAVAGQRFGRLDLRREATRMAEAILREETSRGQLLAGPWAYDRTVLNPSYLSPEAIAALADLGDRDQWARVLRRGLAALRDLTVGPQLPPDWATMGRSGAHATGPPSNPGAPGGYGYDAVRVPVRLAESCDPRAREIARVLWPLLRAGDPAVLPRTLRSRGTPGATRSPVALVGAAAGAHAAGDDAARDRLLGYALQLDEQWPTYYASAWIALGATLLQRSC